MARDTGTFMLGEVFDRGLGFVFLIAATKFYGIAIYGTYLLALSVFQIVRIVVSFGLGRSLVKDIATYAAARDQGRIKGAILLAFGISMSLSIVFGLAIVLGAERFVALVYPTQPELVAPLRVFGLLTPLFAINFVLLQSFYGFGRIRMMVAANNVVEPIARISALLALVAVGMNGFVAIPTAYLIALVASSLVALVLFRRQIWSDLAGSSPVVRFRETIAFALPLTFSDLASRSFRALNTLVLGRFLTNTELGIFGVAFKLTGIVFLFSGSLTAAFRPRIAELYSQKRIETLSNEAHVYHRWILTLSLLANGLLVFFPRPILALMGEQFLPVSGVMRILCVGLFIAQAAGPLMALIVMSGRSKPPLAFISLGAVTYGATLLWLGPKYGVKGVAVAAVAALLVMVPALAIYVWRVLGIHIYGLSIWKPFVAGAVAFSVGAAASVIAPDTRIVEAVLIVGSTTVVYAAMLKVFGIEDEDRVVVGKWLMPIKKIRRKLVG